MISLKIINFNQKEKILSAQQTSPMEQQRQHITANQNEKH